MSSKNSWIALGCMASVTVLVAFAGVKVTLVEAIFEQVLVAAPSATCGMMGAGCDAWPRA